MTAPTAQGLTRAQRRRRLTLGLLRAAVVTVILVAAYYLLPLTRLSGVPLGVLVAVGLITLTVVASIEVKWVAQARHPGIRAVQALAMIAPLFLLLFAATYFLMAQGDAQSFSQEGLTRTDALYFTVTVFSTVGFGDIYPATEAARVMVTAQMILDLIILGLGIRVFVSAVEVGRQRTGDDPTEDLAAQSVHTSPGDDAQPS